MVYRLYVGDLPCGVDGPGLARMFAAHGAVVSAEVVEGCRIDGARAKRSRRARRESPGVRGYGFVEMETDEGARAAIAALHGRGGWLVVREAESNAPPPAAAAPTTMTKKQKRKAKLAAKKEAWLAAKAAGGEGAWDFRIVSEKKLARETRLADELVGALESRFPQEAFHVEELRAVGGGRTGPVVAVKLCFADGCCMLEGTVRELVDDVAEAMKEMNADGATCPFCGAEAPRHRFRVEGRCACGAAAYWEDESPRWPIRVDRRGAVDLAGAPLTPHAMTASRGFVSAGRGLDGLRMWFSPPGGAMEKADLPPPTGWPAKLDDAEMLVRDVRRDDTFSGYGARRIAWLARMASGGVEYVTRSGVAFVGGLRPGDVVRMSATVEGPDRRHPMDPLSFKCGPGVLVLTRCRPPRGGAA